MSSGFDFGFKDTNSENVCKFNHFQLTDKATQVNRKLNFMQWIY